MRRRAQARANEAGGVRYAIVEAPSNLGLTTSGVEHLPDALLRHGLALRLPARWAGRVAPEAAGRELPPIPGVRQGAALAAYSVRLADAVEAVLDGGDFPIVLGGDCSIMLGPVLAARRRGRFGLLFLDGHADFFQPEANPNGEAASMELAFATGRGPRAIVDLEGLGPLVRDEDVAIVGYRDEGDQTEYGSQPIPGTMLDLPLAVIRERGLEEALDRATECVSRRSLDGFWIHLDADVLDDRIVPAVDYRQPGGLSEGELVRVLRAAIGTMRAIGLDITILNPKLDHTGEAARALTDLVVVALRSDPDEFLGNFIVRSPEGRRRAALDR